MNVKTILVTGGAGYVGAVLVPKLLSEGYNVRVLDLFLFGDNVLPAHPKLTCIKADLRDESAVTNAVKGCDAVIHLACISNDPSFELNPELGKSINYDCFPHLVQAAKQAGVKRFIYASSSSVYGVKSTPNVTEDLSLEPLTDYSKYKALCETILMEERKPGFTTLILRPATVCGYSPRLRLDLSVNILTNHAVTNGVIRVFGGDQMRPNIHIEDMSDLYVQSLAWDDSLIDGKIYNAGYENHTVRQLADMVREVVGEHVKINVEPTNDNRSYHISSERISRELGFAPKHSVRQAIEDLVAAFRAGKIPQPMDDIRYYNIKTMQSVKLQ